MNKSLSVSKSIVIKASTEVVWDTLINPEKIKLYLFGTDAVSDWKVGSAIIFQGEYDGHQYKDKGFITLINTGEVFEYNYWSGFSGLEDIPENYSLVRFDLNSEKDKTTLTLTQTGFVSPDAQQHAETSWEHVMEKIKEVCEC